MSQEWFSSESKCLDKLFYVSTGSVFILVGNCHLFICLANSEIFMSNLKTGNLKYTSTVRIIGQKKVKALTSKTEKVKA